MLVCWQGNLSCDRVPNLYVEMKKAIVDLESLQWKCHLVMMSLGKYEASFGPKLT